MSNFEIARYIFKKSSISNQKTVTIEYEELYDISGNFFPKYERELEVPNLDFEKMNDLLLKENSTINEWVASIYLTCIIPGINEPRPYSEPVDPFDMKKLDKEAYQIRSESINKKNKENVMIMLNLLSVFGKDETFNKRSLGRMILFMSCMPENEDTWEMEAERFSDDNIEKYMSKCSIKCDQTTVV